jgi:hypothetical protein
MVSSLGNIISILGCVAYETCACMIVVAKGL